MTAKIRLAALALAAVALIGAGKPAPANWVGSVQVTPNGGHMIGNPAAKVRLVEYISYTCPHCAVFDKEATGELAMGLVRPGKGSIEYRPFLRNIVDVAATLMVNCGAPSRFPGNHLAVLHNQQKWLANATEAQQRHWSQATDFAGRMRAIAGDLHLYELFETRGYDRPMLDRCLADEGLAKRISQENQTAANLGGVTATPSFLVNERLQDAHDWASLRAVLVPLIR